jgi:hypothetical protein
MNVKVDADVVRKAKVVAAMKHTTLTSYITALVRSHVEKDLAVVASELVCSVAIDEPLPTGNRHQRIV